MKFSYKYIIVGAGSAGCVLANKLSENPDNSVLLIEAGPLDKSSSIKMPLAASSLFKHKKYGWCYETEPERNLNNRTINWPRGKTLGGSSSINGMLYIRGQAEDYQVWKEAGNDGWGYRDLMKYFLSLENNQNYEDQYHGNFGPLWVETYQPILDASKKFLNACDEYGLKRNNDFNGEDQEGFGRYQVNIKNGNRFSAADAFLKPILKRPNLDLITNTLVEKIIITNKKVIGVKAKNKKGSKVIGCSGEVTLSGGSINSPQILMLSGAKSGKQYLVPLSYHKHSSSYTCVTLRSNIWWRNLKSLPKTKIWLKGHLVDVDLTLEFKDDKSVENTLREIVTNNRIEAFFANIKLQKDGEPIQSDLFKAAQLHTVLTFKLSS